MAKRNTSNLELPDKWRALFADHLPGYCPIDTAGDGDWFDADAADHAIGFFHDILQFVEGNVAGKPFKLEPWQQAIVGCLMGWKAADGWRRYREALIFVPRKNGKSPLVTGLVLMAMFIDKEPGAQIYSAAASRDQASIIFRHASAMIRREPELDERAHIIKTHKSIELADDPMTCYKALAAVAETTHGGNTHFVVVDELHALKNRELVDTLATSTGTRDQPLMIHITTSDYERESICNEKYEYAVNVRDGNDAFDDRQFLPVIYEAQTSDDWTDEEVWKKANPNLGVSLKWEYMRRECLRAQTFPTNQNAFKRLHLNIKTQTAVKFLSLDDWDRCLCVMPELKGKSCVIGIDLSARVDFTSTCKVFPPQDGDKRWYILPHFWLPEECIGRRKDKRMQAKIRQWVEEGLIETTEGNSVDSDVIRDAVLVDSETYDISEIAIDGWQSLNLINKLTQDGFDVIDYRQGYRSMNEPTKEIEIIVMDQSAGHDGNPVMRWMISNLMVSMDPAGNLKPDKAKSADKIDGPVAAIMGIGRLLVAPGEFRSKYEDEELLVI